MLNIIIGKSSNLSIELEKKLENTLLVSSLEIIDVFNKIEFNKYNKINIIFNQFQQATRLYDLSTPFDYINRSIASTSLVLDYILLNNLSINKIIYTSSSSVYGNNISCNEDDKLQPLSIHSSLKISNEKLIELFCTQYNINYTITRVFNMYGKDDKFSIISKIINTFSSDSVLSLINNGEALRDYIYIGDVVYAYAKILKVNNYSIVNIGTSNGTSIKSILDYLKRNSIIVNVKNIKNVKTELKKSISQNIKLKEILDEYEFKRVESYILTKLKDIK